MVISRKRVNIPDVEALLQKYGIKEKDKLVKELKKLPRSREKAPPPPPGVISIRKAAKKYNVSQSTLSRAANRGDIKIITRTPNWLYIDEKSLKKYLGINR